MYGNAEGVVPASAYGTEPVTGSRFRQSRAQEILAAVLKEKLTGAVYHAENSSAWAREIADEVKLRLKGWAVDASGIRRLMTMPSMFLVMYAFVHTCVLLLSHLASSYILL